MQPGRHAGRIKWIDTLRQQAKRETRQDVARPRDGQLRRGVVIDDGASVGRGDHGIGTF